MIYKFALGCDGQILYHTHIIHLLQENRYVMTLYYPNRIRHIFFYSVSAYDSSNKYPFGISLSFITRYFLHAIQCRTGFEPTDLLLIHCVVQTDGVHFAVFVFNLSLDRLKKSYQKKEKISQTFKNFICQILKIKLKLK